MSNEYSAFKAARHFGRIEDLRKGILIYPTQIQIDLTNLCNHDCIYCFSKFTINKDSNTYFIDDKTVYKLLDDAVKLDIKSFHFTGGGEPFLHKSIYPILERTVRNNLEYGMVTNGTMIDFDKVELLKKMSWVRISIDASDSIMYYKLRAIDEFDKVISTVRKFRNQCQKTILGISFVVNPMNYGQILDFTRLGKDLGVHNIRFSIAWFPKKHPRFKTGYDMKKIKELIAKAEKLQTKDFKIFDLTKGRLSTFNCEDKDYTSCGYQHFTTVIGADSCIYPCCTLKYVSKANFGSLKEHSFQDIWLGNKRTKWLKTNYLKDMCSKNICWMEEKNKFIGYLIQEDVDHVNFV